MWARLASPAPKLAMVFAMLFASLAEARYVAPPYYPNLVEGERIDLEQFDPIIPFHLNPGDVEAALRDAGVPSLLSYALALAVGSASTGAGIPQVPLRLSSFLNYECAHWTPETTIGAFFCAASDLYGTAYGYISTLGIRHANIANRIYGDFLRKLEEGVANLIISGLDDNNALKEAAKEMNKIRAWLDSTMGAYYATLERTGYAAVNAFMESVFGPSDVSTIDFSQKPGTKAKEVVNTRETNPPPETPADAEANSEQALEEGNAASEGAAVVGNTIVASNPKAAETMMQAAKRKAEAAALRKAARDTLKTAVEWEARKPLAPVRLAGNPVKEAAEWKDQLASAVSDRQVLEHIGNILLSDSIYRRSEAEAILQALAQQAELQAQSFKAIAITAATVAEQFERNVTPVKEQVRQTYEGAMQSASNTSARLRSVLCLQREYGASPIEGATTPGLANDPCAKLYAPPSLADIQAAWESYTNF